MSNQLKRLIPIMAFLMLLSLFLPSVGDAQESALFTKEQLHQALAPVALYPDALLAQIMMASTYPLEVVQADQWVKANPNVKGSSLESALKAKPWDPSVKALVQFPSVLDMMGKNVEWTTQLGDAFLAQQKDVADVVQELREKAYAEGNLKTTQQQTVVVEKETIVIQSAQPEVVYVPTYNPTVVYGTWYYPAYPPVVVGPPPGTGIVAFGLGVAVGAAIDDDWGWHHNHWDWDNGDIDIDVGDVNVNRETNISREANVNVDKSVSAKKTTWQHNSEHRKGVAYKDRATSQRYGQSKPRTTQSGSEVRGYSQQAKPGTSQVPGNTGAQAGAGRTQTRQAGTQQTRAGTSQTPSRAAQRPSSGGSQTREARAFSGMGSGSSERMASQRGQSSRSGAGLSGAGSGGSRSGGFSGGGGGGSRSGGSRSGGRR